MDFKKIDFIDDKVILEEVKNFNIKQTFECGQCFRWEKVNDNNFIGIVYGKVIEVEQNGNSVIIHNTSEKDFNELWIKYFDLERDYSKIKLSLSKDDLLKQAIEFGYGIRLLNQDPFELLISFIISARNSIPVIMKTIKRISENFGNPIEYKGKTYYSFPTPSQLKKATLEDIQSTGASFRSKYILDTVNNVFNSSKGDSYDIEKISSLNDDDCHKALQEFMGVGAKVADCIMLFSMSKYSAFPVDVWVKRAMQHFYLAPDVSLPKIRIFAREKFGELSGFAQQYLFYYARENKITLDE